MPKCQCVSNKDEASLLFSLHGLFFLLNNMCNDKESIQTKDQPKQRRIKARETNTKVQDQGSLFLQREKCLVMVYQDWFISC